MRNDLSLIKSIIHVCYHLTWKSFMAFKHELHHRFFTRLIISVEINHSINHSINSLSLAELICHFNILKTLTTAACTEPWRALCSSAEILTAGIWLLTELIGLISLSQINNNLIQPRCSLWEEIALSQQGLIFRQTVSTTTFVKLAPYTTWSLQANVLAKVRK